ncbi:monosaccharide transporter [Pyrenophora tritici-repentis]|uniref:Monosaccharide transporter n=2 Tax=Pyrenophora tritici-repentis TaxID=45151 RepID=A0A922T402_9PLEO|nr:monosaccharide transporter [Pyrenophora tritici-repentis]KAI1675423.1 monosaccharide transporter [Pyrenophora tritici-repentis]KAI1687419.1 monosaccharide transporter [Pyrenophora tritici-repentis]
MARWNTAANHGGGVHDRIEAPVTVRGYLLCVFAAFGGILFGYDSGYINGVLGMNFFKQRFGSPSNDKDAYSGLMYRTWEKSLIVSILSAGTFFGALIAGSVADWIGRRSTIIAGCGIFSLGVALQVASTSVGVLVPGRLIAGFGIGFVSAVIILYMSEIAPKRFRGAIVSGYQFCITIGLLLAAVVDNRTQHRMDSGSYRIPMSLQWLFALVLGVGLFLLPESPRWYIKKGRNTDAARALATLRGQSPNSDYVNDELKELVANHEYEMRTMRAGWGDCFTGGWKPSSNLRRVVLGMALQMMQQWTGVNFIFYYGSTFFKTVGIQNAFLVSMITTAVNFGRRPLLIFGAIGMLICEFIIAIVGTVAEGSKAAGIVLIVFTCIYIFFFASTWGPGAWVLIGEIFPLPIRAKGVALSTASNWFWNFVISFITPYMVDQEYGNLKARVFFVWGATCTLCVVFAYFLVPETKGLSLEQVDHMLEETTPRNSAKWVPHSRRRDGADVFSFDTTEKKGDLKAGEHREHGVVV